MSKTVHVTLLTTPTERAIVLLQPENEPGKPVSSQFENTADAWQFIHRITQPSSLKNGLRFTLSIKDIVR
jgi:hypothetical protein